MIRRVSVVWGVILLCSSLGAGRQDSLDAVFFPSDGDARRHSTTPRTGAGVRSKQGYDSGGDHIRIQPSRDGGFSASASHSNNFAGSQSVPGFSASHAASQSHSLNFQVGREGFSASQSSSASQASSFNSHYGNNGPSLSSSQSSSQSSSFSGGGGTGGSAGAASSQAASAGFSGGGGSGAASLASGAANSQSWGPSGYTPSRGGGSAGAASSQAASAGFSGGGGSGAASPANSQSQPGYGYNRAQGRQDRRRKPGGPFYNSWFNPFRIANVRYSRRG